MSFSFPEIIWSYFDWISWANNVNYPDAPSWVKEWSPQIIGITFIAVVAILVSLSSAPQNMSATSATSTSSFSLSPDTAIQIISVNKTVCSQSKRISEIQVTGNLLLKTSHSESTISIKLGECNSHKSIDNVNEQSFVNPIPQLSIDEPLKGDNDNSKYNSHYNLPLSTSSSSSHTESPYQSEFQGKYVNESVMIDLMHRSVLKRILTTGRWSTLCSSEDVPREFPTTDILEDTSFISIKFLAFSINTESENKAAYIGMQRNFTTQILKSDSDASFSKSWKFNPSRCLVSYYAEVIVIPMEIDNQDEREELFPTFKILNKMFQSTLNIENRCSHLTREMIVPSNMTGPSVILSVMICH